MSISYDLVIAGGGLAGATLAKNMAEQGAKVLVIEREREFKDRVRGECMFPWGNAEAHSLGIAETLAEAGGYQLDWAEFYVGIDRVDHRSIIPTTPHHLPCLACYHPAMQESLLRAAESAGAKVRRGATVREARTGVSRALVVEERGPYTGRRRAIAPLDDRRTLRPCSATKR